MLISLKDFVNKYDFDIKGVIQVGAHWAEEHDVYMQLGVKQIVYIEPCEDAFQKMLTKLSGYHGLMKEGGMSGKFMVIHFRNSRGEVSCVKCACGEVEEEMTMHVAHANQGQSNSLLKPQLHLQQHPEVVFNDTEVVEVRQLDNIIQDKEACNLLVLDVQGAEGLVLKGALETLKHIDCIYTEINKGQTYEGNMEIDEMDEFLGQLGFERVETFYPSPNWTWGDAIYLKRK